MSIFETGSILGTLESTSGTNWKWLWLWFFLTTNPERDTWPSCEPDVRNWSSAFNFLLFLHYQCWRRTSLELGTVRAETKRKNNQFARTSLGNKIKQLVRNQPRSRTRELSWFDQLDLHPHWFPKAFIQLCQPEITQESKTKKLQFFPKNPPHLYFFLYKIT